MFSGLLPPAGSNSQECDRLEQGGDRLWAGLGDWHRQNCHSSASPGELKMSYYFNLCPPSRRCTWHWGAGCLPMCPPLWRSPPGLRKVASTLFIASGKFIKLSLTLGSCMVVLWAQATVGSLQPALILMEVLSVSFDQNHLFFLFCVVSVMTWWQPFWSRTNIVSFFFSIMISIMSYISNMWSFFLIQEGLRWKRTSLRSWMLPSEKSVASPKQEW